MSNENEIKSCPACGGKGKIWTYSGGDCADYYSAGCSNCDLDSSHCDTEKEAIEAWNNQPAREADKARIAELEAKVQELNTTLNMYVADNIEVGQENQELKAKVQELSRIHESEIKELENETFELDELFQQINELQQENQELKTKLERVREEVDKGFQTSSSTYGLDHGVSVMEALSYIEEVLNDA